MDGSDASKGVAPMSDAGGDAAKDCSVKVAVHIRPLISHERLQGCMDCISVVPGEPQVQIGNHSFTYDHVYGSTASPSSAIFEECVAPLVDGLFQGYNATVLAYGQTGSGKTYTMGTAYSVGGNSEGVIPLGIDRIFRRVEDLSKEAEVMLKVSFIEILKEEIHDLLDSNAPTSNKSDVQCNGRIASQGKPPAQIRETCHGGITLTGVQEVNVTNKEEMIAALSQGSLNRATGSTNMNNQSSRSHAIFTINLSSKRKWNPTQDTDSCSQEEQFDDFVCAKLHLVDLAGSERAKRTGADGVRLKEGIHINRGLLALGNVISALGDDKKRKERGHIPYRDSKLTRLLQDSLGGNSRTVMIACVSPADTNAEETLNTLKYANRARNIQNKAVINRDPLAAEMDKMRHQLHYLEAQLREGGVSADEIQILKHKVARLEKLNAELSKDLQICQIEKDKICLKLEKLRNGRTWEEVEEEGDEKDTDLVKGYLSTIHKLQNEIQQFQISVTSPITRDTGTASAFVNCLDIESNPLAAECETFGQVPDLQGVENEGDDFKERESEESEKEIQFSVMQDLMDKEMRALDQRLEEKETEMKMIAEASVLKQHYEKKLRELEEQKRALQMEMDRLRSDVARLSDENSQKAHESYVQKLKQLEAQIADMRKSQESQAQLLKQKKKSDEAAKKLQDEILRIKQQRVQLQNKIKRESESFRAWKAAREKEVLKLKKEGRRNEYEMNKLQALNQRQRMVLQRKTEEAGMLTKKLKDLLESKKQSSRDASAAGNGSIQGNEKALKTGLEHELEVVVRVHEVRTAHQKQTESRAAMAKELEELKRENQAISSSSSMSPGARRSRIAILESMIDTSSKTIVDMASQLSESEERERAFSNGKSRWNQLRSMGDAKSLLNYLFDVASQSRCQARDKELEIRELKEHVVELRQLLKNSEYKKKELEKQVLAKEQMAQNPKARLSGCSISDSLYDFENKGDELFPYDLRKASRNYNLATETITEEEDEDMDISDGEEESDDEWTEDEDWVEDEDLETRNAKRNRASMRPPKTEKQGQCEDKDKKPKVEGYTCCTCSKVSGCKTKKCECRAVGNVCGSKCGCKIGNCSNREGGSEMQGDLSDSKASPENPQKPDTEIKKEFVSEMQAELTDSTFTSENLTKPKLEVKTESQVGDIDQALSLLQSAMKQNISLENSVTKEGDKEEPPEGTEKKSHRRPLTDIGNTSVTAPKANPRKKWKKSRIQIVPVVSQTNTTPKETMLESENSKPVSSVTAATTSNAGQQHQQPIKFVPQNKEPATSSSSSQESSIPLKLPRSMHRSSSSLSAAHPLRARNSSSEEGSKDMVGAPGSPSRGGSRGQNGKENVRYNN